MGLGYYTYIAARILPLAVVAGTIPVWGRGSGPRSAARLALALAVAALVALPIGAYFWRHPELFWGRVETASGGPLSVGDRVVNALGLFVWHGDDLARHNLPGRPVFEPLAGGLFLLGLAICLRRWREPGYAALPATCAVMLLPQALAWGEPHFLRAAGVLPAAQVAAAIGLEAVIVRLACRLRAPVLIALALLWAGLVARDYFGTWARSRAAYEAFEGEGRAALELLRAAPADAPISAGSRLYADRATFYFAEARQPAAVFEGSHALVLPADGQDTILARPADVPAELRARLGDPTAVAGTWPSEDGQPAAALYRADPRAFAPIRPLPAVIGAVAAVEGYDLSASVRPGGQQRFVLAWRALGPAPPGLFQFAHALAADGPGRERVWAIEDAAPFPSRGWRGGERALTWFDLRIPLDAPSEALWVETGFYEGGSLRRLPVADPSGAALGDRLLAGPFKVWDPRGETPRPDRPAATFADGLLLAQVSAPAAARAGQSIPLRLAWWSAGSTATPLTVFVHLLDEADRQRAGADGPPAGGANPTTVWQPGETVLDDRSLPLPADLPPGRYRIECGLYDAATGRRLTLQAAPARLDDGAIVATVDVK
jgi:hypothetical protein